MGKDKNLVKGTKRSGFKKNQQGGDRRGMSEIKRMGGGPHDFSGRGRLVGESGAKQSKGVDPMRGGGGSQSGTPIRPVAEKTKKKKDDSRKWRSSPSPETG